MDILKPEQATGLILEMKEDSEIWTKERAKRKIKQEKYK
jgi:hypothetical protein